MSDIVFLDTETLGTEIDAPIWELAAIRRRIDGTETPLHLFIDHEPEPWISNPKFPESFKEDYRARYRADHSMSRADAAAVLKNFLTGRPHIVGAVINFDTERIAHQLLRPKGIGELWNYHLIEIENQVHGYLRAVSELLSGAGLDMIGDKPISELLALPWNSNDLSRAINVDPDQFERHTAMGDVRWCMAQYDALHGDER
ncbi:hypothetical protein FZI85_25035 [Mycobacterium sp. CBMA293]|uniref:hypothetical protein n=1 Tax=unclassified Mycolicibacterium TaxID=2636767 RepID=UPI00132AA856|nr:MULTISPECIES: hypothetical protein [unclassified Mycolicibacterium]MUL47582.1 hypothetical protein [Mycolicibacterium sp. CBMA 360]MUL61900.1 hypothetical protein [Mycolicibacterium sp. CBMA 335]MUL68973.1 hypothetical protein [Mycolicibacterium sp. CBMA 311]MUL92810.1 hypothetical protein [Mycolicibacterium sp. CBMA 230]MUM08748.1 hypothetical protein [Mycolicibacterium sp. CBMA 213]